MSDRIHGTHNCYVHGPDRRYQGRGCRCEPCRQANSAYEKERSRRVAPPYIDAGPAREHVRALMAAGVGLKTISSRASVAHGTLWKLIYGKPGRGPSKRIRPETANALLSVTAADAADGAHLDAAKTWRHIDTLLSRGWTKKAIAEAIGQNGPGLQIGRRFVTARNARAIEALLDRPVPPRRTRHGEIPSTWSAEAERRERARKAAEAERRAAYRAAARDGDQPEPDDALPFGDLGPALAWMARGACRGDEVPTWIFFPAEGDRATGLAAKRICQTCPVKGECLEFAIANDESGIWGGTSDRDRQRMRVAS